MQSKAGEPFDAFTVGRFKEATSESNTRMPLAPVSISRPSIVTHFVVLPGAQNVAVANAEFWSIPPPGWLTIGPPLTEIASTLEPLEEPVGLPVGDVALLTAAETPQPAVNTEPINEINKRN